MDTLTPHQRQLVTAVHQGARLLRWRRRHAPCFLWCPVQRRVLQRVHPDVVKRLETAGMLERQPAAGPRQEWRLRDTGVH